MAKQWYIIHTYSGFEDRVQKTLEQRVEAARVVWRHASECEREVVVGLDVAGHAQGVIGGAERRLDGLNVAPGGDQVVGDSAIIATVDVVCPMEFELRGSSMEFSGPEVLKSRLADLVKADGGEGEAGHGW